MSELDDIFSRLGDAPLTVKETLQRAIQRADDNSDDPINSVKRTDQLRLTRIPSSKDSQLSQPQRSPLKRRPHHRVHHTKPTS